MGKMTFTERARLAAQGEAVGEKVENLVFLQRAADKIYHRFSNMVEKLG